VREQVEKVIASLKSRWNDRRLDVFALEVASAGDGGVKLAGRVLDAENLSAVRDELRRAMPGVRVEDSGVTVLRRNPPTTRVIATNLTDLHVEPSFLSEMLTQMTNGTELTILEERDRWSFVRQADGYMGWALTRFQERTTPGKFTHIVTAPAADVYGEPRGVGGVITRLLGGTSVCVVDEADAWLKVQPIGSLLPAGWVWAFELRELSSLPITPDDARKQILSDARQFTGTYYLWGGCSAWGIDCSGLAQLSHRLSGYTMPRDCDLQFAAGRQVEAPFRAGDLLYFHNESRTKIGHVGISTGVGSNIIHSSRGKNGVYEEDVKQSESLQASYAGARSFLPS
jgi:cell wall-associated NlpC family hydrolase